MDRIFSKRELESQLKTMKINYHVQYFSWRQPENLFTLHKRSEADLCWCFEFAPTMTLMVSGTLYHSYIFDFWKNQLYNRVFNIVDPRWIVQTLLSRFPFRNYSCVVSTRRSRSPWWVRVRIFCMKSGRFISIRNALQSPICDIGLHFFGIGNLRDKDFG